MLNSILYRLPVRSLSTVPRVSNGWGVYDSKFKPSYKSIQDLPEQLTGPQVWNGKDLQANPSIWLHHLSQSEIKTILEACKNYQGNPAELTRTNFGLDQLNPSLTKHLFELREELLSKHGFFLLRGLPVHEMSRRDQIVAFMGLGTHLGQTRLSQNGKGHVLGHVKSLGEVFDPIKNPETRLYRTSQRQRFHSDSCDLVGLLCLNNAPIGGDSLLVSVPFVYNKMREENPELLWELFGEFWRDRKGEHLEGELPYESNHILTYFRDQLIIRYDRNFLSSGQRLPGVPILTSQQILALDTFDHTCEQWAMKMRLQPGDIQFVNNLSNLHDRTAFQDDQKNPRHLLRLWLSVGGEPGSWYLPWDLEGNPRRGGIWKQGVEEKVALEAE